MPRHTSTALCLITTAKRILASRAMEIVRRHEKVGRILKTIPEDLCAMIIMWVFYGLLVFLREINIEG